MRGGALFALISVISDGKAKQLLSELQKTAADAQSKIDKALAERRAVDKYKVAECERLQNATLMLPGWIVILMTTRARSRPITRRLPDKRAAAIGLAVLLYLLRCGTRAV
jgi:hypothetical protein